MRRYHDRILACLLATFALALSPPAAAQNTQHAHETPWPAIRFGAPLPAEAVDCLPRSLPGIECGAAPRQPSRARDDAVRRAWQQRNDRWFAADKLRHFFASYGAVAIGYGSARLVGIEREEGLRLAVAGGAVAGVAKEWSDVRSGGPFSVRDLVWDAAGIATAYALLRNVR